MEAADEPLDVLRGAEIEEVLRAEHDRGEEGRGVVTRVEGEGELRGEELKVEVVASAEEVKAEGEEVAGGVGGERGVGEEGGKRGEQGGGVTEGG